MRLPNSPTTRTWRGPSWAERDDEGALEGAGGGGATGAHDLAPGEDPDPLASGKAPDLDELLRVRATGLRTVMPNVFAPSTRKTTVPRVSLVSSTT